MTRPSVCPRREARAGELGLTLVELLISIVLFSILAAGAFAAFSGQQSATIIQQRSDSSLDAARAVITTIGLQLRSAKAGAPDGRVLFNHVGDLTTTLLTNPPGMAGANCRSGVAGEHEVPTVQVVDGGASGPDILRILLPDGAVWGTVQNSIGHSTDQILFRTKDAEEPLLTAGDWVLVSDLGGRVVLFQDQSPTLLAGSACAGQASDWCFVTPATASAAPTYPAAIAARAGFLLKARWIEYSLDSEGHLLLKNLLANSNNVEPAADAIDDLQVALGYDWLDAGGTASATGDGQLNADGCCGGTASDEWIWNDASDAFPGTNACDLARLRAVRITVVARTTSEQQGATDFRPAIENRSAGSADGYYRVVLQSVIALR